MRYRRSGFALLLVVAAMLIAASAWLVAGVPINRIHAAESQRTEEALMQARVALLAYATAWPKRDVNAATDPNGQLRGPGFLPCPDLNDDGVAEAGSCGNAAGTAAAGQVSRLGRLPWRTLGLPDLRDGTGQRLWYAVSSKYKSNTRNNDLNPDSGIGTISVRDASSNLLYDGSNANVYGAADGGGVVAVVIAPGSPLERWEDASGTTRTRQARICGATGCDSIRTNYLDKAAGIGGSEDNADFIDRNTAPRSGNTNGFIQGPVRNSNGDLLVNDRLTVITYVDIMQAMMTRVAQEAAKCLTDYAMANGGRYPYPAPVCRSGKAGAAGQWSDARDFLFGRIPDPPFVATNTHGSVSMSPGWVNVAPSICSLGTSGTAAEWWDAWKNHVFYVLAPAYRPDSSDLTCDASSCLQIVGADDAVIATNKQIAVLVSGAPLSPQLHGGDASRQAGNFLERSNRTLENMNSAAAVAECSESPLPTPHPGPCAPLSACNKVTVAPRSSTFNDVVVFHPRQ